MAHDLSRLGSMMSDKPLARLIRENEALMKVAFTAARLRRLGRATEAVEEATVEFRRANPGASRSATVSIMVEEAFQTAMKEFDLAIMEAAEIFKSTEPFTAASLSIVPKDDPHA